MKAFRNLLAGWLLLALLALPALMVFGGDAGLRDTPRCCCQCGCQGHCCDSQLPVAHFFDVGLFAGDLRTDVTEAALTPSFSLPEKNGATADFVPANDDFDGAVALYSRHCALLL
jgi:hypothetical protein